MPLFGPRPKEKVTVAEWEELLGRPEKLGEVMAFAVHTFQTDSILFLINLTDWLALTTRGRQIHNSLDPAIDAMGLGVLERDRLIGSYIYKRYIPDEVENAAQNPNALFGMAAPLNINIDHRTRTELNQKYAQGMPLRLTDFDTARRDVIKLLRGESRWGMERPGLFR